MEHNPDLPLPTAVIPHRPPHLWLDGVIEAVPGEVARGFWRPGQEHFAGHFEGMPLLPGVKQIEALAQLGAYAMMLDSEQPSLGIFQGVNATFELPARPEETLELKVAITDRQKRSFTGEGIVSVNGLVTCRATLTGAVMSEKTAQRLLGS